MGHNEARITKLAYGLDEINSLLGIGRSTIYQEIRAGRLKLTKVGKRSIVLADDLAAYLEGLKNGKSASPSKCALAAVAIIQGARSERKAGRDEASSTRS